MNIIARLEYELVPKTVLVNLSKSLYLSFVPGIESVSTNASSNLGCTDRLTCSTSAGITFEKGPTKGEKPTNSPLLIFSSSFRSSSLGCEYIPKSQITGNIKHLVSIPSTFHMADVPNSRRLRRIRNINCSSNSFVLQRIEQIDLFEQSTDRFI